MRFDGAPGCNRYSLCRTGHLVLMDSSARGELCGLIVICLSPLSPFCRRYQVGCLAMTGNHHLELVGSIRGLFAKHGLYLSLRHRISSSHVAFCSLPLATDLNDLCYRLDGSMMECCGVSLEFWRRYKLTYIALNERCTNTHRRLLHF